MKKGFSAIFAVAMLAGCSSSAPTTTETIEAGKFTAGTYEAVAAGRNGDVKLTVTTSANKIEKITAEQEETSGIGDTAIEQLIEKTLEGQGIPSDTVSGATISSTAYLTALADALTQAGGKVDELKIEETASTESTEYVTEADVIVVGAGGAGLTAAVTASQDGASVILLEKSSSLGGNTVAAANGTNAADSKVQLQDEAYTSANASVEGLVEVQSQNDLARVELVEAFAKNSGEVIDWISDMGVEFVTDIQEDSRNPVQNYYMLKAVDADSTAIAMVNAVKKTLETTDVNLYYNMDATKLVTDESGTVIGVVATDEAGNEVTFSAKSVVLATGGFGQNQELLGKVNERLANAITDEIAPTTGEGLLMAQEVGAKAVDLGEIQTFPVVIPGYGMVTPNKLPGGFMVDGAIYVNQSGQRFTAEAFESVDAVLSQENGLVYMIFGEEDLNENLKQMYDAGFIVSADTSEELAEKLGVDGDALADTINAWNKHVETGSEDEFGRQGGKALTGTLYGFQFGVGAHYFMGGVLINENTQVLNENEEPISGLYAAGEVTGGFHGSQRIDGSGIGDSFTFGRIAGHQAAK